MFRKLGKAFSITLLIALGSSSFAGCCLVTLGVMSALSITSSSTVVGIPAGILFGSIAIVAGFLLAVSAIASSARPTWNFFSKQGQRIDNYLYRKKTGKLDHLKHAQKHIDESSELINDARGICQQMFGKIYKIQRNLINLFKKKDINEAFVKELNQNYRELSKIDITIDQINEELDQINVNSQRKLEDKNIQQTELTLTKNIKESPKNLFEAYVKLEKATNLLKGYHEKDPVSEEKNSNEMKSINNLQNEILNFQRTSIDIKRLLADSIKEIEEFSSKNNIKLDEILESSRDTQEIPEDKHTYSPMFVPTTINQDSDNSANNTQNIAVAAIATSAKPNCLII